MDIYPDNYIDTIMDILKDRNACIKIKMQGYFYKFC